MPKSENHSFMDFLPVKEDPFRLEPEILEDGSKYGWRPAAMEQAPSSASFWEDGFFAERENPCADGDRASIIGALLKEAGNGGKR